MVWGRGTYLHEGVFQGGSSTADGLLGYHGVPIGLDLQNRHLVKPWKNVDFFTFNFYFLLYKKVLKGNKAKLQFKTGLIQYKADFQQVPD